MTSFKCACVIDNFRTITNWDERKLQTTINGSKKKKGKNKKKQNKKLCKVILVVNVR